MADGQKFIFDSKPTDKANREHRAIDPTGYTNLTAYLEAIMLTARVNPDSRFFEDYLLNIMAARWCFNVAEHNKDALDAALIKHSEEPTREQIANEIQKTQKMLFDNEATKDYLKSRSKAEFLELVSNKGHGGKLERDFRKHVCMHEGPMLTDTPKRYMPNALKRIEALQKQLKGLDRNAPESKVRAKQICMEILATRAAVDCTRGDKSTLKKSYDPAVSKRYYDGMMNTVGKNLSTDDLNRLVRGALKSPGHGGTMESVMQELVRKDMVNKDALPSKDIPSRYQVTYGDQMNMLHGKIAGSVSALKSCRELSNKQRAELKSNLVELYKLGRSVEDGNGNWKQERAEFPVDPDAKTLGGDFAAEPGVLDPLMEQLVCGDDALDKLDSALSQKDGTALEKVNRFLEDEMGHELTEPRTKNSLNSVDAAKLATSDNEVKGMDGTKLARDMAENLSREAKEIHNDRLLSDEDKMRRLRLVCDKRMAMSRAYLKSIGSNKQLDKQKYAMELHGVRFQQSLREVRRDPAYQRTIQNIVKEAKESGAYMVTSPIDNLYNAAMDASELQDSYLKASDQLEEKKNPAPLPQSGLANEKTGEVKRDAPKTGAAQAAVQ